MADARQIVRAIEEFEERLKGASATTAVGAILDGAADFLSGQGYPGVAVKLRSLPIESGLASVWRESGLSTLHSLRMSLLTAVGTERQTGSFTEPKTKNEIVILIHGIRTAAEWQEMMRHRLRDALGVEVKPVRYGYFDIFSFL